MIAICSIPLTQSDRNPRLVIGQPELARLVGTRCDEGSAAWRGVQLAGLATNVAASGSHGFGIK